MKPILILICLFTSLNIFAVDLEGTTLIFHERMLERAPTYFSDAQISLLEEVPEQIQQLAAANHFDLINFAISLDLFSKGFEYRLNDEVYEVVNAEGQPIAYTFSITIMKNGQISSIGMYEAQRRVDGVFYISREPVYY
jgi:putative heme iron utilization protein